MEITNPNYYYGRGIIWRTYKNLLYREREEYEKKNRLMKELGRCLLDVDSRCFSVLEIVDIFNAMPEEDRKILYLRYCYGLQVKELAPIYGITPSAMSQRITKCRKMFRAAWEAGSSD
jgi:RNA polymerase sigma factor (sigma-70 family)